MSTDIIIQIDDVVVPAQVEQKAPAPKPENTRKPKEKQPKEQVVKEQKQKVESVEAVFEKKPVEKKKAASPMNPELKRLHFERSKIANEVDGLKIELEEIRSKIQQKQKSIGVIFNEHSAVLNQFKDQISQRKEIEAKIEEQAARRANLRQTIDKLHAAILQFKANCGMKEPSEDSLREKITTMEYEYERRSSKKDQEAAEKKEISKMQNLLLQFDEYKVHVIQHKRKLEELQELGASTKELISKKEAIQKQINIPKVDDKIQPIRAEIAQLEETLKETEAKFKAQQTFLKDVYSKIRALQPAK